MQHGRSGKIYNRARVYTKTYLIEKKTVEENLSRSVESKNNKNRRKKYLQNIFVPINVRCSKYLTKNSEHDLWGHCCRCQLFRFWNCKEKACPCVPHVVSPSSPSHSIKSKDSRNSPATSYDFYGMLTPSRKLVAGLLHGGPKLNDRQRRATRRCS